MKTQNEIELIYDLLFLKENHEEAVQMFHELEETDKEKFFEYANLVDGCFSNASDWQDENPPTLEESKENILILINEPLNNY